MDSGPIRLSLCMIVRDEEERLPRALASVEGLVDELIIVDTGSRDCTVAIAEAAGARVIHVPWTGDFATARNAALAHARGDWILVLDADEQLAAADRHKLKSLLEAEVDGYILPIISRVGDGSTDDVQRGTALRLFRNHPRHRYAGLIHEDVTASILAHKPDARLVDAPVRLLHDGYLEPIERARSKGERNREILERELARNPESAYHRFALGVEQQRANRPADALALYRQVEEGTAGQPWEPKLHKNIVHCMLMLGRWAEAIDAAARGLTRFPGYTDLLYLKGIGQYEQQAYAKAVATFSQCAAMGPAPVPPHVGAEEGLGSWKAHYALGRAFQALGRLREAVSAYERALALQPAWRPPLEAISRVLLAAGVEPGKVRRYLEERLGEPSSDRALAVALMLSQGGAVAAALEELPPSDQTDQAAHLRGSCKLGLGDWSGSLAAFAAVPAESPLHAATLAGVAYCRWCLGDEEGYRLALEALDGPGRAEAARLFVEAARTTLAEGLACCPDSSALAELLARARRELP